VPAPKSEAEMLTLSDLVVDAKCVTIVCDGKPVDDGTKVSTKHVSTLWPSKSYKGGTPKSITIRGLTVVYKGLPPTGGWHQGPIAKGWVGKLYLKKETDGSYSKVWWNGEFVDTVQSKPEAIPTCAATDGGVAKDAGATDGPGADAKPATDATPVVDAKPVADAAEKNDAAKGDGPAVDAAKANDATSAADAQIKGDTAPPKSDDGGCGCAVDEERGSLGGLALISILALSLLFQRRKRG